MRFEGIDDDDVVISGIGCKLPNTDTLPEFTEKLFQGTNFVTQDDRKRSPSNGFLSCFFLLNC